MENGTSDIRVTICAMCAQGFHNGCTKPTASGCCCQASGMSVTVVNLIPDIAVITKDDMVKSVCNTCDVGYDPLHMECYECSRKPGRKDNYRPKV
jgi:hypothetical protein